MVKLAWDQIGTRKYETGTDHGALFVHDKSGKTGTGVAWSGLTKVTESPEGGEETALYADNIKYLSLYSVETLGGTIEAYTYPDEFEACDGSATIGEGAVLGQQGRQPFSLAYRTIVGTDTDPRAGYKLHLLWNLTASPSERAHETVNETPGALTFSWGFKSTAVPVVTEGYQPTSVATIDSTVCPEEKLKAVEDLIYGTAEEEASMPTPDELIALLKAEEQTGE